MDPGWWFLGAGTVLVVAAVIIRSLTRRYYQTWNRCAGRVVAVASREIKSGETGPYTLYRSTIEFENTRRTQVRFEGEWGCPRKFAKVGANVPVVYLDPNGADARIDEIRLSWAWALGVMGTCHLLAGLLLVMLD